MHCALGLSQLGKLRAFVDHRRTLVEHYDKLLAPLTPFLCPVTRNPNEHPAWHLYQVLVDFDELGLSRFDVMRELHERGIGTQVHYIPVHCQPYYRRRYGTQTLSGAENFYGRCLSLPLFSGMKISDVDIVVRALNHTLGLEKKR